MCAHERFRWTEARFASIFEAAPDALLIVAESGNIVEANRVAEETFGYSRAELLDLAVEDLVPEASRRAHRARRTGFHAHASPRRMGTAGARFAALRKDGTVVPVEIGLSPLHAEPDRLIVAAIRDVTSRVRVEEELRQVQKLQALGTLAGGIAHDFNNLLTVIAGNAELARERMLASADAVENLAEIGTAVARASDLVERILAFSRQQTIHRRSMSVRAVVAEVARQLAASVPSGIRIATALDAATPNALVDPTQLHRVLLNLGTNAWHALDGATGTITFVLDTHAIAPGSIVRPGRYVRIQVVDDGKGMDAATIARIFDPFFTTKEPGHGSGLGLAVAHGIVAEHGGAITVDSAPGRGATFAVYLPETEVRPSVPEPVPSIREGTGHVLLVDDDERVVRIAKQLVERLGYRATVFQRPHDAIDAVRADPQRFDVVITDQNMPEMDGFELARAIAALRADLPIVLTSGNLARTDDLPSICFRLEKPYSRASLGHVLELACRRRDT